MSIFGDPQNIGEAFGRTAERRADAPALRTAAGDVTYAQLDARANAQAQAFKAEGVERGDVVAICQDKTAQGYAAMLGALKLGAPYLNLDPASPQVRVEAILATAAPTLLVSDGTLPEPVRAAARARHVPVRALEETGYAAAEPPTEVEVVAAHDLAYLMFTSGSTGQPKGVAITHGNLAHFLGWAHRQFDIRPDDVLTGVNPIYFDNAVYDTFAALLAGACLAPVGRDMLADPPALVDALEARGCTQWFSVPSLLIYLMTLRLLDGDRLPALRQIAFGGEGYPLAELERLWHLYGHRVRILNVYGPTEATCICSAYPIRRADFSRAETLPPLGRLADNVSGILLDGDREVAAGETGELCLIGPTVGAGYYNDPERTAAAFASSPVHTAVPRWMYRTGDLVRRDPGDGLLYFAGRKDNQIKHLGYRIELEEIEAALARVPEVRQAAVVYTRRKSLHGRIVAFVAAPEASDAAQIRERVATFLPPYMTPHEIHQLDVLPKNANGKVDRHALAAALSG